VEIGTFTSDDLGNVMLVNRSGHTMARAPAGSIIPTLESLPQGLSSSLQITPIFITPKGTATSNYCIFVITIFNCI
jgi:hypothetical protein